jgi:hypothetical protein
MFISTKHLSRRAVSARLERVGRAAALLDAMVPAHTALAQTAAVPRSASRYLRAPRRDHGSLDAETGRHELRDAGRS